MTTIECPTCEVCGKDIDSYEYEAWLDREGVCDDCWQEWKRQALLEQLEWERGLL